MIRFLCGETRAQLATLESESVQTVVTSPPYWGLRDYGLEPSIWDGNPECVHEWGEEKMSSQRLRNGAKGGLHEDRTTTKLLVNTTLPQGSLCRCGAWRGCLGLEPTPDAYVAHLVEVFHAVWRVLRKDGTLWLNLGDSYAGSRGLKPKDLVGIPWRVAFALQAAGWTLRQDIIWAKPNPMPESVTDRCTKAHEYVFLLTKGARYFFDAEAIKEPAVAGAAGSKFTAGKTATAQPGHQAGARVESDKRNKRDVWTVASQPYAEAHFATFPPKLVEPTIAAGSRAGDLVLDPFGGSGTTALVAKALGRDCALIDQNAEYMRLARKRCGEEERPLRRWALEKGLILPSGAESGAGEDSNPLPAKIPQIKMTLPLIP